MPNWIEGATADEAWYNAAMGFHADKDYDVVDGGEGAHMSDSMQDFQLRIHASAGSYRATHR